MFPDLICVLVLLITFERFPAWGVRGAGKGADFDMRLIAKIVLSNEANCRI